MKFERNTNKQNANQNQKFFGMFHVSSFRFQSTRGITLLLVVLVLSALLSISLGIFNSVFTEFRISGEIADSFTALYAADQAVERALYLDRGPSGPLCGGDTGRPIGVNCYVECAGIQDPQCSVELPALSNGSCYRLRATVTTVSDEEEEVQLSGVGEYRCDEGILSVKRALETTYIRGAE